MAFHNVPPNGFPDIPDIEDLEAVQGDVSVLKSDVSELKSGLINYQTQNDLNLEVANRKNILPLTIAEIKTSSTAGTWSGNNYTVNGVTFAVITDENGAVTSVNATGTASADAVLIISRDIKLDSGNYIMNGCPNGGSSSTYEQYITTPYTEDVGDGVNFTITTQKPTYAVKIVNGYATPIGGLTFYPMLRLATETDPTFAPYIPSVDARLNSIDNTLLNKFGLGAKVTDIDAIKTSGFYNFTYNATGTPSNHSGILLSMFDLTGSFGLQIAKCTTDSKVYIRRYDDPSFTNWAVLTTIT